MQTAILTLLVFVAAWTAAYLLVIRRWLLQYARTAGLMRRIEAAEGSLWAKVKVWSEGKKTLGVAFLMSALTAAKSALDSTALAVGTLQPSDIEALKDQGVWRAFFDDGVVLKIVSGLALATGLLAIRGHLTAAKIEPNTDK